MLAVAAQAAAPDFSYYGTWSNVVVSQSEDPHAQGFELTLWRHHGGAAGIMSRYVGPVGDPPVGELEDVKLDAGRGTISFRVRMSQGMVFSETAKAWVRSSEHYVFSGTITRDHVRGTLRDLADKTGGKAERVEFTRDPGQDAVWSKTGYEEWRRIVDEALAVRGPKRRPGP